jgi:hypothetical protein
MALPDVIGSLRQEEQKAVKHLDCIRAAISSLSASSNAVGLRRGRPKGSTNGTFRRRRRRLSAKARKAICEAQKARWAKLKRMHGSK